MPNYIEAGERRGSTDGLSAIGKHIVETGCVVERERMFTILQKSQYASKLPYLEAAYIRKLKPMLCRQKETIVAQRLPWSGRGD